MEKLEEIMTPEQARAQVRRLVVRTLRSLGVNFNGANDIDNPTLWCAREAANLIRSDRNFQSVATRMPRLKAQNQPHHDQVRGDLRRYGIVK